MKCKWGRMGNDSDAADGSDDVHAVRRAILLTLRSGKVIMSET